MSENPSENAGARRPNRLVREQSPYLRQHAYNPVDWYPWGEEALARAKTENKPVLLSIGYSACHWCHVMEHESFENEETARLMNELFVPVKVDREERPDLDQIYMEAVQAMTGRGGWPLTMFLTPDAKPFYGGTYFPPEDRHGLPGFRRVLTSIAAAYRERSNDVTHNAMEIARALAAQSDVEATPQALSAELPEKAAAALAGHYDRLHGGIGEAPKFPNTFVFSLFLRMLESTHDPAWAEMVEHTLTQMAKGGVYDQIGGGFHRYSVDRNWRMPHFEKMLYDNALLARLYLDAGRALRRADLMAVARDIFDYVLREMGGPEGGFCASQDADSEGEEGRYFVWTLAEVRDLLGPDLSPLAERYYDIVADGIFEGSNIPHRTIEPDEAARMFGLEPAEVQRRLGEIRRRLFEARERRVHPGRDDKVLAAWNGMMIGALAEGALALEEPRYLAAAEWAADFVMTRLWDGHRLRRSWMEGVARFNAYLEDYAAMANGLIDLYEASLEPRHLSAARTLAEVILAHFADDKEGGFFFTSDDHEQLLSRGKPAFDGSTPSGNSDTVMALLRLHAYTGEESYFRHAERALKLFAGMAARQPFGFTHLLEAADFYNRGPTEIVLMGDPASAELRQWHRRAGELYLPNRTLFARDSADSTSFLPPAMEGKKAIDGRLTAYVCRNFTCSAPQTTLGGFLDELKR